MEKNATKIISSGSALEYYQAGLFYADYILIEESQNNIAGLFREGGAVATP